MHWISNVACASACCRCTNAGAAPDTSKCGRDTEKKITWLQTTAALLGNRTQANLWNEEVGAFVNKCAPATAT